MDFELKQAKLKWEKEQRERKERARALLEREKKLKEDAVRQQEAVESAQRSRRLEAAEARAIVEQQEIEDLHFGDGIKFHKVLNAVRILEEGDKIKLPFSAFEELSSQNAIDKGPMFFEVYAFDQSARVTEDSLFRITHAGVLEFTSKEGFAELPIHVWENAGLPTAEPFGNPCIRLRYARLPQGKYVKLQTAGSAFFEVPNHKAVLEAKLRRHATLSEGDIIRINYGGTKHHLRVLELRPGSHVSLLETDIEVDLIGSSAGHETTQERSIVLTVGKAEADVIEEGRYKYFKFNVDQALYVAVSSGEIDVYVHLDIQNDSECADSDLYVAAYPVLFPSQHQYQWASHSKGTKVICLTDHENRLHIGPYGIGIYGAEGFTRFTVCVSVEPRHHKSHKTNGKKLDSTDLKEGNLASDFNRCANCSQPVPVKTIALHEAYCRRHNIACQHPGCFVVMRREETKNHMHCDRCGQAFRQDELRKHVKVFHEPLTCSCGIVLEMQQMVNHRNVDCPDRVISCKFCGDLVRAGGPPKDARDRLRSLTEHESSCGSRTDSCQRCGRVIMLKEMDLHQAAAHSEESSTSDLRGVPVGITVVTSIGCPICGRVFDGHDREQELSSHLDSAHFSTGEGNALMEKRDQEDATFRRTFSVACPICGLAVHSERDLSVHIDMVH